MLRSLSWFWLLTFDCGACAQFLSSARIPKSGMIFTYSWWLLGRSQEVLLVAMGGIGLGPTPPIGHQWEKMGVSLLLEKAMAPHSSTLAWKIPWTEEPGGLQSMGSLRVGHDFTLTFHFHTLEKEMATHSSVLDWRIPGMGEPGGLPSMGLHRVGHDWNDAAAAAAASLLLESSPGLLPLSLKADGEKGTWERNWSLWAVKGLREGIWWERMESK